MTGRAGPHAKRVLALCALAAVAAGAVHLLESSAAPPARGPLLPDAFVQIAAGPDGGTVWEGVIPDRALPALRRPSVVYLPARVRAGSRLPVLYLLHGFRGSPLQFAHALELGTVADRLIASGGARPFIAVAPPAGLTVRYDGEWGGRWERYLVGDVVPWTDAHLPTIRARAGRAIAGLSAGGFGAVDIGLRHPRRFATLESWSGYFRPLHDGPFRHADPRALAAHDPSLLVRREARLLHRLGTRFYLSSGSTRDPRTAAAALRFAGRLNALRLPYELYLRPGGHNGRFWRSQLSEALRYALPAPHAHPSR